MRSMAGSERIHPYIPNSVPEVKARMLAEIGVDDMDTLYEDIPEKLRFRGKMNIPPGITSEMELRRHVERVLSENHTCEENVSFLGGGCYQHYVPAVCDEITGRAEFLTAYAGEPYEDHGRFQALFEYQSLMGELLETDVVNVPTYDWGQAASTAIRMAGRITGRDVALIADTISPDRLQVIRTYCEPVMRIESVGHSPDTAALEVDHLCGRLNDSVAVLYVENPSYLGTVEEGGRKLADTLHDNGSIFAVGVDPISLGVLAPPSRYGADITCGDIQSLGNHMYFGGALGGFIATCDDETFVMEYPSRLFGICKTERAGEWGFGDVAYGRTSFAVREHGREFVGTAAALYGISAAVYLSLMGPAGMRELDQHILQKSQYAMRCLSQLEHVRMRFDAFHFKEFVVDFSATGKSVTDINRALLEHGIFGGRDLGDDFADLEGCALYAVTEVTTRQDIDRLVRTLTTILA
ncbi:MAG: aminomethyl-transferring glycine dehydrogenase subunit GcvPA [Gemmatimonadota bacterium]|nr:MAG: aminomethyl-transferring glycine dehydrogenase subunit GcvPA [Gemmatimonadota bacterium]